MTDAPSRRRAPGMSPDRRREMVVQAALPLIAERGAAVTTAQIARAAGIGEATVFRVFADKDAVLQACVATVLDPAVALQELDAIDLDQPLPDRLLEAADALAAHLDRMGTVLGALHASGTPHRRPSRAEPPTQPVAQPSAQPPAQPVAQPSAQPPAQPVAQPVAQPSAQPPAQPVAHSSAGRSAGRDGAQAATRQAVAELFEPERDRLRLPPDVLAEAYLRLLFGRTTGPGPQTAGPDRRQLIDLLVNGALRPATTA